MHAEQRHPHCLPCYPMDGAVTLRSPASPCVHTHPSPPLARTPSTAPIAPIKPPLLHSHTLHSPSPHAPPSPPGLPQDLRPRHQPRRPGRPLRPHAAAPGHRPGAVPGAVLAGAEALRRQGTRSGCREAARPEGGRRCVTDETRHAICTPASAGLARPCHVDRAALTVGLITQATLPLPPPFPCRGRPPRPRPLHLPGRRAPPRGLEPEAPKIGRLRNSVIT